MLNEKLKWYIINKEYIEYLKQFDCKVQNINYEKSAKPYIGIILNINNFNYYVPISSVKQKHYKMSENIDFIKITNGKKILSVINLNNMIPILNSEVEILQYRNIKSYFNFKSKNDKIKYISLLRNEMSIINNKRTDIINRANNLYQLKYKKPNSKIACRCCEFKLLEEKCIKYKI